MSSKRDTVQGRICPLSTKPSEQGLQSRDIEMRRQEAAISGVDTTVKLIKWKFPWKMSEMESTNNPWKMTGMESTNIHGKMSEMFWWNWNLERNTPHNCWSFSYLVINPPSKNSFYVKRAREHVYWPRVTLRTFGVLIYKVRYMYVFIYMCIVVSWPWVYICIYRCVCGSRHIHVSVCSSTR